MASGYNIGLCRFKDMQTGEDFPFDFALSNMVHGISGLTLVEGFNTFFTMIINI